MKLKILLSTLIYSLIGVLMLFQTNIVLAIASDPNNPITAAITSAIGNIASPDPSPSPSATPQPSATPNPTTNYTAVNLAPPSGSSTPNGSGTLTVTLTEKLSSGSVGVIEKGFISGLFKNLTPNTAYTIWLIQKNFLGFDPVRSEQLVSDQKGNIPFFTTNFEVYHRVDQPIEFINIAYSSLDNADDVACSKYSGCLSSSLPAATPTPTPTAFSSAAPSATPSAQPISSPITDDEDTCLDFWFFTWCFSHPILSPTPVPSTQPVSGVTQEVKTWMLEYHPSGDYFHVNGDNKTFTQNVLLPAMNEGSKQALNYTLADEDIHTEYNPPPLLPNSTGYDYKQLFTKYDLCNKAKQKDIKAVILWADGLGEYGGGMWESAVTGSNGIPTNGAVLPGLCDKTIVIYGLNYTRGLAEALESYAHHLERVFGKFRGEYANWADRNSCGNAHNPPNSAFEYDRTNSASFQSDCRNFKADNTGSKETLTCNVWGCSGDGWLKFWMQNMPSDWWTLIANPDGNSTTTPTTETEPTPTPSGQPISTPVTNPDGSNCIGFWIFSICLPDFISPPISIPVVIPSPTPSPTPTPIATPAPVTPVINTVFPNPATQGTNVTLTGSGFNYSSKLHVGGVDYTYPQSLYSVSEDGKSLTFVLTTEFNYQADQILPIVVSNGIARSNSLNLTVAPSIIDPMPFIEDNQKLIAPAVTLDEDHSQAVITGTNFNTEITIPATVAKPTLKFNNRYITQNKAAAFFANIIKINTDTSAGIIKVQIPSLTTISGPLSWNGVINAPQILSNSLVTPPAETGKTITTQAVLEVGAGDTLLTFDKAVRLLIPNQAGKLTGYQRGSIFTKIAQSCSEDSQTAGDILPASDGDCYISVGSDMVIWTKHFTKFVTYTETAAQASSNSGSNSSSGSSGSSPSNNGVCTDSKPASAPKLLSAKVSGRNEVTLSWSKAADPVTYYLVTYGTKSGIQEYGNPNIGGKDTTSYVVRNLQDNQTYYFKIRAGNNCMSGEFSNEIAVKASGNNTVGPAKGFKTASSDADIKFKPITQAKPQRIVSEAGNVFTKLINFLTLLFNR